MRGENVLLIIVIIGSLLSGCAGRVSETTPSEFAQAATAMYLDCMQSDGSYVRLAEVRDRRILEALKGMLAEAKEAEPPERWSCRRYALSFDLERGGRTLKTPRYAYLFKTSPPGEPGHVEFPAGWYGVPSELGILLKQLAEYKAASGDVDRSDEAFLAEYGWTPLFLINSFTVTLPRAWTHHAGEYPEVLYWAYNNELNKDVGLDLTPYLGKKVEVFLYKTEEPLPEFMHPRREMGRAVVVREGEKIIGAWLDAGRHHAFACSLKGRRMEDVTGKTWEEWIPAFIDPSDPLEKRLSGLSPEDVIRTYFEAIAEGDYRLAHACETRRLQVRRLFANMDNNTLHNPDFEDDEADGFSNIIGAEVLSIETLPRGSFGRNDPPGARLYQVEVDLKVRQPVTYDSGPQPRFILMVRETPATGWRIESVGTGP